MSQNKKPKIILVEDDLDLSSAWGDVFELLDYDFHSYPDGISTLKDKTTLSTCDVLITDYYLPDMNGISLIETVREVRADLPIILLTGSKEVAVEQSLKKISNTMLMNKPVNIDDIEVKIAELLKPSQSP